MTIARDNVTVEDLLSRIGLRRTRATEAVLDFFLSNSELTVTHADLEAQLAGHGLNVNRVTLYRLLDRLVVAQVLEKHPDELSRNWRFGWRVSASGPTLPRFECDECHRHFDLPEASGPTKAVAEQLLSTISSLGYVGQRVDLSIHGTCAGCNSPHP
ncbi:MULTISPECIES: Fur family transcriptional regulator [Comamonadaceae]|uniref:Fur family transcriptional regulator n=1 Tax=Comamonadaceae TaxID=80864 RepID=UPI0025D5B949|nr:Fur family transcriptional regulator [Variovorax sp.]